MMARTLFVNTDILDEMVYFLYQKYTILTETNKLKVHTEKLVAVLAWLMLLVIINYRKHI